jgi:mycothiol synthase
MSPIITYRNFRGASDYPQLAAVLNASEAADQAERNLSAAELANAYQHLSNCDPVRDVIIAEAAGEMVGYTRGWWDDETGVARLYIHNGFLLPQWRRKGIGGAMLSRIEARLREVAATHPEAIAKYFQVGITQYQVGTAMLLEGAGYQPTRDFYSMVRPSLDDLPAYPLPSGVELRPVTPEHYRAIWQSVDETSQDEWGYQKPTEAEYQAWLAEPNFQPELWQVAWDPATERVVGHVLTYIDRAENAQLNRRRGYTEGIGVARAWRRRGLARALISRSLQVQKSAGMTESALVADSESQSGVTRLYESCGFVITRRDTLYRKPL